jgi:hypothetical protein
LFTTLPGKSSIFFAFLESRNDFAFLRTNSGEIHVPKGFLREE